MRAFWIRLSKIALLLVCIGFFMPISCNLNGFNWTQAFWNSSGKGYAILVALIFVAALISVIISFFIYRNRLDEEPIVFDGVLLATSILGGSLSIGRLLYTAQETYGQISFQLGAYLIIIGWILSLIFLIKAAFSKKE